MINTALVLILAFSSASPISIDHVETKDVTAPPEDIISGRVCLPDPSETPTSSWTALLPHEDIAAELEHLVPGPGKSMVAVLAENADAWGLEIRGQPGLKLEPSQFMGVDVLIPGAVARTLMLPQDADLVHISVKDPGTGRPGWILLADGQDDLVLKTHLGTRSTLLGSPVGLYATLLGGELLEGTVRLRDPLGQVQVVPLQIDGPDRVARFTPDQLGDWTVQTVIRARDDQGIERLRTTQQIMRVVRHELTFVGEVVLKQAADGRVNLNIPVSLLAQDESTGPRRVAIGCEVWGRDASGVEVPVCWAARMQQLPSNGGPSTCSLRFDPDWLTLAGVEPASLSLRALRAHTSEGFVLLAHDAAPVSFIDGVITPTIETPQVVSQDMLGGRSGEVVSGSAPPNQGLLSAGGHVLLISHGYCTDQFPWRSSDFSGDIELYEDYGVNVSHDTFALRFEARGRSYKSMGIAGHSQGGNAAAHLYTFYWSALDWPTGGRPIQGVGVPWQGTSLAGNAAVLGEIFGIGCGTNYDMTYEASAAWLSFIPSWVREDVWFWTTSFTDGWFYDYCQIVTDVLLVDPDDGTVERYAGQLDGANNGGHKTGWCHIRLMRDPPQCKDPDRNVELSAEAAR
jgi:hypothetical protein